jgi:hypothetical protein
MMKMKLLNILIVFCLGLLMTGVLSPKSASGQADKSEQVKESVGPQEAVIRPKVQYKAQGLKDPFLPLIQEKEADIATTATPAKVKPLPVLNLQALVWGGNFPQAIINNKVVKIGDVMEEAQIVGIGKEGVILLYANKKYKLSSPSVAGPRTKD